MKEVEKILFLQKNVALVMIIVLLLNCLIIPIRADESVLSKVYCTATLEDDFTNNEIIIVVFPEFNNKDYQIDDFSTIDCIEVKELSLDVKENTLGRILKLTIEGESKQNVLDAINILEQRDDIYCAEPNYLEDVEVYPNDSMYVSNDQWAIDKISLPLAWNINKGLLQ